MPTKPILFSPLDKSADKPDTSVFNQNQRDGYWQEYQSPDGPKLIWRKRPGLTLFKNLMENSRIDGLHYWTRQQYTYASTGGKMYRITSAAASADVTGTASMAIGVRPSFTDLAGTNLYAASSGRIGEFPAASTGTYIADADAPTAVRFIGANNQILIALNDESSRFDWSETAAPTNWTGQFATAEASPGLTQSFHVANAYLYFFGQEDLEIWRDNGVVFVRETQGSIQRGCIAPYSVKEIQGSFFWLDDNREVSRIDGFSISVISNPVLTDYIRSFTSVADARGDYLKIAGKHFYILSFPVERKTLVYDITLNHWYEWGYYNTVSAEYDAWIGCNIAHANDWNKVLAGDRRTAIIYEVTTSATTDNGNPIRTVLRTDFIDHGRPESYKSSHELTLVFKRADTNATPGTMQIRYRDDGKTDWSPARTVNIEAQGYTEVRVNTRRLGIYRRRQWEFIMSDPTLSAMVSAEERFDYGR